MSCKRVSTILNYVYKHKNTVSKECATCVYYQRGNVEDNSLCLRFGKEKEDKLTGINFFTAKAMREDTSRCGPDAYYHRRPYYDI